ncbi:hypothetical protein DV532_27370 (plasmid) [Pseudomonas sp. Leaf58]|uniref:hypothetical protein n=1 Tax=Pseudomonas sp. Leaf58 TaxID=1736226 RepID=UPI0006FE086B|nr:hypothetical protein [Pseudomonas sp. Leaf58]AYG48004.1 hypothetical protein DV532_27370 [Pseudomonas sp. Leaf58]KQN62437.1 hypothetical protein ASF02_09820 [Pseudomonas sp. Leaf58]
MKTPDFLNEHDAHQLMMWRFKRIEQDLQRIVDCFHMGFEEDLRSHEFGDKEPSWEALHEHEFATFKNICENFENCVEDICYVLEHHAKGQGEYFQRQMLSMAYKAVERHPIFQKDTVYALPIMERRLPFTAEYYVSWHKETPEALDVKLLQRFLRQEVFSAEQLRSMAINFSKKQAFQAMDIAFRAWGSATPIDSAYTMVKTDFVWQLIIESQAYTSQYLYPGMEKFIKANEKSFETILPMLSMGYNTPEPKLLIAMKNSGFGQIALEVGQRVLHRKHQLPERKYHDLDHLGVEIPESFIRASLNEDAEEQWRMSASYFLDKDALQIDLSDIELPWLIQRKFSNAEGRFLYEQQLIQLLKSVGITETARNKRQDLLSIFMAKDQYLIKRLIKQGLPESYMEMESVREEKLCLDLGL